MTKQKIWHLIFIYSCDHKKIKKRPPNPVGVILDKRYNQVKFKRSLLRSLRKNQHHICLFLGIAPIISLKYTPKSQKTFCAWHYAWHNHTKLLTFKNKFICFWMLWCTSNKVNVTLLLKCQVQWKMSSCKTQWPRFQRLSGNATSKCSVITKHSSLHISQGTKKFYT